MEFRAVKGMNDILADEIERWQRLELAFRRNVGLYGYSEIRTPVLEHTELFVRSIGEATDVVEKEMFTFQRHKESLTLRPEGTAGVARAYVNHTVHAREPVTRWFYIGPMFRAEEPQRGRYRQFHQAGCELFGDSGPLADAEMIDMLVWFLEGLGYSDLEVCINSIGGPDARLRYRDALLGFLTPKRDQLSEHARQRLELNPLRVLDSKDPRDQNACQGAPSILDVLEGDDQAHWEGLKTCLQTLETPFSVTPGLVRGLDYYTRTLFEIKSQAGKLGSQNTLVGGGRYDGMVKSLGGPHVPAIGFALGLERILLGMPESTSQKPPVCYLAPIGEPARQQALGLAKQLRHAGVVAELDGRGNSVKSMLRRANSMAARFCVLVGDSEIERNVITFKDLAEHSQVELPLTGAAAEIAARVHAAKVTD